MSATTNRVKVYDNLTAFTYQRLSSSERSLKTEIRALKIFPQLNEKCRTILLPFLNLVGVVIMVWSCHCSGLLETDDSVQTLHYGVYLNLLLNSQLGHSLFDWSLVLTQIDCNEALTRTLTRPLVLGTVVD